VNPIALAQSLEGLTLIALICGLLSVEELGLPLPFAPGDLLLALAGIAIAAGRVDPLTMVGAALVSIVVGAMLGRELFSLLGWHRVLRVADRFHARAPLERASQMLQRNGWRAVFTARLIPGLRVHTTQVAGLTGMRRLTFLAGLVPSVVVYVGAFMGLGFAFGRPILAVIHNAERQALVVVAFLAVAAVLVLWLRVRALRLISASGGWAGVLKFRPGTVGIALIPACIGLNFTGHAVAVGLKLPLFLDSIGTVLGAVLAGPWVGASIGLITNLVSSNTVDPIAAPYALVSVAIGFGAGVVGYLDQQRRLTDWLALWAVCFMLAALLSTPLNLLVNDGRSGVPLGDSIYSNLLGAHLPKLFASFAAEAAIDIPDKLLTVVAALLIYRALPMQGTEPGPLELDIGGAFTFVFHSRRWLGRILVGSLCLAFFWLVLPFLLLMGYAVAVARAARAGDHVLPAWEGLGAKVVDGFRISALFLIWNLPGLLLGVPAEIAAGTGGEAGFLNGLFGAVATVGGVWTLLVVVLQSAIWSQYLRDGFAAALNAGAVLRRVRLNAGLAIVVGALVTVLSVLATSSLALILPGLLAIPYALAVGASLFGRYSRLTDGAVAVAEPAPAPA
jgi:energy-coupling factor transport system substrate-specific component